MTTTDQETLVATSELHRSSSIMDCPAERHGTASAYTRHHCRCTEARRDKKLSDYERASGRPRTVDATGTRRRIQALLAIGWPGRYLMAELGWPGAALGAQFYQQPRVARATAAKVAAIYVRLSDTRGPSSRTRIRAERAGYLAPLWWDEDTIDDPNCHPPLHDVTSKHDLDPVNVDRACDGQPVTLTRAERLAAVCRLHQREHSYDEIATRLHVAQRQVHRDLTDLGLTHHQEATG